eukprot:gnl/Trimastix_PCT/1987.p1 GENE.gnl/Trimastix_PCT/1987~~gnl/Trimastix_PCT/1987.p1  ORF type:complete len:458 (+),score=95.54 gnl/Trimastix_PCT/1987:45-1418(+)
MDHFLRSIPEWERDDQMSLFFAPFPDGIISSLTWNSVYEPRVSFWTHFITKYCSYCNKLSFDPSVLAQSLKRKGSIPLSISFVVNSLIKQKKLIPLSSFSHDCHLASLGWGSWTFAKLVADPLTAALGKLSLSSKRGSSQESLDDTLVSPAMLEHHACALLAHFTAAAGSPADLVLTREELREQPWHTRICAAVTEELPPDQELPLLSDEDVDLLVMHLVRTRRATLVTTSNRNEAVRLSPKRAPFNPGSLSAQSAEAVADLKSVLLTATRRLASLQEELDAFVARVRSLTRSGTSRGVLLAMLRQKKGKEKAVCDLHQKTANLSEILLRIQSAQSDQQILAAYEVGAEALSALCDEERAARVMGAVATSLDKAADFQDTLAEEVGASAEADADLEAELDALERSLQEDTVAAATVPPAYTHTASTATGATATVTTTATAHPPRRESARRNEEPLLA